ncbi:hypothetical protein EDM59_25290 [Brevibacillus nitrificans]|uniref:Fe/B12 periplasmic-binding domain-containing protein n=1 Tax=Brevibacillus nitrificans TaxID=651560 RepID=A0A3M8D0G0_9BACL|nr:ABC transporter substrate-binding protein [Brevibacillus nitrificans]RNB80635.1 hypothetical protein EDM59_25290 [Brevibacillus nitrificans]
MKKSIRFLVGTLLMSLLISACGTSNTTVPSGTSEQSQPANVTSSHSESGSTRVYTDYKGRKVEVPNDPKKIVYIGSNPGDLLAIGVKPVGATLGVIASQIAYPELLDGIEDVGYPFSAEKVLDLQPDLILFDDWDETGIETLNRIAPTAVVGLDGTFPTKERVTRIAELLSRTDQAAKWFDSYQSKVEATKAKLHLTGKETTATLLLLGKDMYIMGNKGLNTTLYGQLGFQPSEKARKLVDANERFIDISDEVLPEYMGTHMFVLTDTSVDTVERQKSLTDSNLWKTIPAVKEGRVYWLNSKFNYDDPITLDRLLDEIVTIMSNPSQQ